MISINSLMSVGFLANVVGTISLNIKEMKCMSQGLGSQMKLCILSQTLVYFYVLAGIHILTAPLTPTAISALTKILPLWVLVTVIFKRDFPAKSMLMIALIASMAGDVALDLDEFWLGVQVFLIVLFAYAAVFVEYTPRYRFLMVPVLLLSLYCGLMVWIFWPVTGEGNYLLTVYAVVITITVILAVSSEINGLGIGMMLFLVSDSLVTLNRFVIEIPGYYWLLMSTYYFAQAKITTSILNHHHASDLHQA